MDSPALGEWTAADLPEPAERPGHDDYHRREAASWSLLSRFSDPFPDGGAETYRDVTKTTPAMLTGALVNRALLEVDHHPPAAARAGVIPIDARRGSIAFEVVGELVRRLADRFPEGWTFPPTAETVEVAVGPNKGKDTAGHRAMLEAMEDPDDHRHGYLPVVPGEWNAAVEFAGEFLAADPGAWASAPSPLVVRADEWATALQIAGKISHPETAKARAARRLLLGAAFREYFAEWAERVRVIGDESIACPCGHDHLVPSVGRPGPVDCWWCSYCDAEFPQIDRDGYIEIPCRLLADAVGVVQGSPYVADLKAVLDPAPESAGGGFDKIARVRRYHYQLAFYRRGLANVWSQALGRQVARDEIALYLVPAGNQRPYAVDWRPLDPELIAEAEEGLDEILYQFALRQAGLKAGRAGWEMEDESKPIEPYRGRSAGYTLDTF